MNESSKSKIKIKKPPKKPTTSGIRSILEYTDEALRKLVRRINKVKG